MSESEGQLAVSILRKMCQQCLMFGDGFKGALIDSGWVDVTDEELAYLKALWKEANG